MKLLETNAKKITAVSLVMGIAMMMMFQNCGQAFQFEGTPSIAESPEAGSGDIEDPVDDTPTTPTVPPVKDPTFSTKSVSFMSSSSAKPVDMVWVIDNSGSMVQEAAHVRNNFQKFVQGLQSSLNINVALISRTQEIGAKTQVSLPSGIGSNNKEIDYFVDSYNPMLLAAASTCSSVVAADDGFCGSIKMNSRYDRVYGGLNSFFREGAQKVFVFVTDDDSSAGTGSIQIDQMPKSKEPIGQGKTLVDNVDIITANTFSDRMKRAFGAMGSHKVYGFVAFDKTKSPCLYRESKEYSKLIASANGTAYNICEADWTQHFAKLSESIVDYAKNEYTVDTTKLKRIVSVKLNGQLLTSADVTIKDGHVTLNSELVKMVGSYKIDVVYEEYD